MGSKPQGSGRESGLSQVKSSRKVLAASSIRGADPQIGRPQSANFRRVALRVELTHGQGVGSFEHSPRTFMHKAVDRVAAVVVGGKRVDAAVPFEPTGRDPSRKGKEQRNAATGRPLRSIGELGMLPQRLDPPSANRHNPRKQLNPKPARMRASALFDAAA
jgi:hypothetical protein